MVGPLCGVIAGETFQSANKWKEVILKIVMISEFYGESLTYQENLMVPYYNKLGHSVTVVTSTIDSVFDYFSEKYDPRIPRSVAFGDGAKVVRLPFSLNFLNRVRMYSGLSEVLEAESPDLIFVHNINFNLINVVRYLRKHPRVRMVVDCHADYSNSAKSWISLKVLHGILRKSVLRWATPYVSRIFPITPACADFLRDVYDVPAEKMELLPLGADLDLVAAVRASGVGKSLRERYGIPGHAPVVFTGGKLTAIKYTEVLIAAVKQLKAGDAWLFVVGSSTEADTEYLEALKSSAAGSPRIIFTGWLSGRQILEHLDMCDIAAFPAAQSALWQIAIGMGKPLVIGDPRARPHGTQDVSYINLYGNILVTSETSISAAWLTDALDQLIADPEGRARMAEGALRVASEVLDWNKIVTRTLAV